MPGLTWRRVLSPEVGPYSDVEWEKRDAVIKYQDDRIVFQQKDVEVPKAWSQLATNIVVQKYFRGHVSPEGIPSEGRETSVRQVIDRVVDTIAGWAGYVVPDGERETPPEGWAAYGIWRYTDTGGIHVHDVLKPITFDCKPGEEGSCQHVVTFKRPARTMQPRHEVYFADKGSWEAWRDDLKWLYIHQHFSFNSPVLFNVGVSEHPQCAACFLLRMEDHLTSDVPDEGFDLDKHGLLAAQVKEGIIFSNGSGSGINLSRVRSKREFLSGGGRPSGPLSFARGLDSWATVVKSGGKTRRAAKMLIMDVDHPDIMDFIRVKAQEEKIAKALIAAGWPGDMDGEAYQHAFHQNSNLSVRVSGAFMQTIDQRGQWDLISRSSYFLKDKPKAMSMIGKQGHVLDTRSAYEMMQEISRSCWESGDPGMLFADTIDEMHTCPNTDKVYTVNPCSEYVHIDESSCNLASFNLARFLMRDSSFDVEKFVVATRIATIAMDTIISNSRYPTENIARVTNQQRTIGLGYANLGGLLMRLGIAYDSDAGRTVASTITSLLTSGTYLMSAEVAKHLGPFATFEKNREPFFGVMTKHAKSHEKIDGSFLPRGRGWHVAQEIAGGYWEQVLLACAQGGAGLRNAQASVIAPTGTISFLMDCDTTGIEPELALVKYKQLAGGGTLKIVNPLAANLAQMAGAPQRFLDHIAEGKSPRTCLGSLQLQDQTFIPGFIESLRTSFPPSDDPEFALPWQAHVKMMAAVQPFVSGAISKTINMPESSTVEDIIGAYVLSWHMGLKCVAIYRDNCKAVQAISTSQKSDGSTKILGAKVLDGVPNAAARDRLYQEAEHPLHFGQRRDLPSRVLSERFKFSIDGHKGFMHVGYYPGTVEIAEIFVNLAQQGSAIRGFVDAFCRSTSIGLQHGAPLEDIMTGFLETSFEPYGPVQHDEHVRTCRSVVDFLAKKLLALQNELIAREPLNREISIPGEFSTSSEFGQPVVMKPRSAAIASGAMPTIIKIGACCRNCGSFNVVLNGTCKVCMSCGSTEGGCYA